MSVLYAPDTNFAKEMVKHEAQYSQFGPGLRPYVKRDFPMMMHKAGRPPANGLGADEIIETCIVETEHQATAKEHEGFKPTPLEALEHFEHQQFEIAELAAERNHNERRMSPKAQAEAEAFNAAHPGHQAEVLHMPIPPRRRPPVSETKE